MKHSNVSINAVVMSFMIMCAVVGALTLSVASAATIDQASGSWVKKDYAIKGGWSIEKRNDQNTIVFDKKFKTKNGPDLKVFLSKNSIAGATGHNATDNAVFVAKLKKSKGKQEYVLPSDIDLSQYTSILIHCEAYSVLWGGADFNS